LPLKRQTNLITCFKKKMTFVVNLFSAGAALYDLILHCSTTLAGPGNTHWRGMFSTVDLLVLTSLDQLLWILKIYIYSFYKTSYLYKEVKCTEPSPSVSIPWLGQNQKLAFHCDPKIVKLEIFRKVASEGCLQFNIKNSIGFQFPEKLD